MDWASFVVLFGPKVRGEVTVAPIDFLSFPTLLFFLSCSNELFPRAEKIAATIGGERHGREIWKNGTGLGTWEGEGEWWLRGGFRV